MNSLKHFRQLQAQYMPKRVIGHNVNNLKIIKKLVNEQGKEDKKPTKWEKRFVYKSEIPKHWRKYPNFTHKSTDIINVETRLKVKPDFTDLTKKVKLSKGIYKIPTDIEDIKHPIHDAIDFKQMAGNEIILNMSNSEYFRDSELINGLYELGLRVNLNVNNDVKDYDIVNHPYIGKALTRAAKRMDNLKVF
jgi:hypothetical protein